MVGGSGVAVGTLLAELRLAADDSFWGAVGAAEELAGSRAAWWADGPTGLVRPVELFAGALRADDAGHEGVLLETLAGLGPPSALELALDLSVTPSTDAPPEAVAEAQLDGAAAAAIDTYAQAYGADRPIDALGLAWAVVELGDELVGTVLAEAR